MHVNCHLLYVIILTENLSLITYNYLCTVCKFARVVFVYVYFIQYLCVMRVCTY